jgi:transcriptional regulator with XRE-family HTH domain
MQVSERIKALMEAKKASATTISHIIGQSETSIYNYLKGKNEPTISVFTKIVEAYPDINSHWLLTGMGEMLLEESSVEEKNKIYIKAHNYNAGNMQGDMNVTPTECKLKLAIAMVEIGYLKEKLADKDTIISLLSNK